MAVKSWTGAGPFLSFTEIVDEFGGTIPHSLSEYYGGAGLVGTGVTGDGGVGAIPTTGAISFRHFYGTTAEILLDASNSDALVNSFLNIQGCTPVSSLGLTNGGTLRIPANYWLWSNSTGCAALIVDVANCTIINEGNIIGRGGDGGGNAGGPAISITATGVTIQNEAGAYIAGGGGGGGGAGGGGAGGGDGSLAGRFDGNTPGYTANGGSLGQSGGPGNMGPSAGGVPAGGGAGGGGGNDADPRPSWGGFHGGGGGGRILPGTGGAGGANTVGSAGGDGGSAGNPGEAGYGGGGGGWGATGGNATGGAGGAAITAGSSYTLNNSGTIYGST